MAKTTLDGAAREKQGKRRIRYSMPSRLAALLSQIRLTYAGRAWQQQEFADELRKHIRRDPGTNLPAVKITRDIVVNLEKRRSPVNFAHLEAYARLCNLRTGWLLLISQHSQDAEANVGLSRLRRQLQLFIRICDRARESGRSLDVSDVHYLGQLFEEHGYVVEAPDNDKETIDAKAVSQTVDFRKLAEALDSRTASKDQIKKAIRVLVERL